VRRPEALQSPKAASPWTAQYSTAPGKQNFSDSFLAARAEMLTWKTQFNDKDTAYDKRFNVLGGLFATPIQGDFIYEDLAAKLKLDIDGINPTTLASHYVRFGDAQANTLMGDTIEDRLYGGAVVLKTSSSKGFTQYPVNRQPVKSDTKFTVADVANHGCTQLAA
jgi:hypothetical protein